MAEEREVVKARRIELTDSEGRVVMTLGTDKEDRPELVMMDESGREMVKAGISQNRAGETHPWLSLYTADRKIALGVGIASINMDGDEYQEAGLWIETPDGIFSVYGRDDGRVGIQNTGLTSADLVSRKSPRKRRTANQVNP